MPIETWPSAPASLTLQQWQADITNLGGDRHGIMVAPGVGSDLGDVAAEVDSERLAGIERREVSLNSNTLRPAGWTSGDAAGLPMFPALVRYDECERGMVEHALRLVVAKSRREYIYPANHYASQHSRDLHNYPAMGQRLGSRQLRHPGRLDHGRKSGLRALKKYGAIVADNGGFFSVSVCPDNRFPATAFNNLSTIGIDNFEVVQTTGPNEGPRSPGAPTVSAGPDQFVELGTAVTLHGVVNVPAGNATVQWKLYSGPNDAAIADASSA